MGYQPINDTRWVESEDVTLASSVARTATGTGTAANATKGTARLLLSITAGSGTTPTLDVTIQTSYDNATWRSAGTFTQATAVSSERKSFSGLDRYIRAIWTIGGTTPSFTFSVTGEAV